MRYDDDSKGSISLSCAELKRNLVSVRFINETLSISFSEMDWKLSKGQVVFSAMIETDISTNITRGECCAYKRMKGIEMRSSIVFTMMK